MEFRCPSQFSRSTGSEAYRRKPLNSRRPSSLSRKREREIDDHSTSHTYHYFRHEHLGGSQRLEPE